MIRKNLIFAFIFVILIHSVSFANLDRIGLNSKSITKINPTIYIDLKQTVSINVDNDALSYLDLLHVGYAEVEVPFFKHYSMIGWIMDMCSVDINAVALSAPLNNHYNYFNFGIDNIFKVKKFVQLEANIDAALDSLFDGSQTFSVLPLFKASGNYYTGVFWNMSQSFSIQYNFNLEEVNVEMGNSALIGYEFFRFYGPDKLRLGIELGDEINYSFTHNVINNKLDFGVYTKFYNIKPEMHFFSITEYWPESQTLFNQYIGIKTSISYSIKNFAFFLEYIGSYEALEFYTWNHTIKTYFKVNYMKSF